ncbi:MAG: flippase [Hydrococcus sp. Prado102]|jgi:O-antigen/teichoic acid export membrane protein|nr:flippase [Hydrococcus sp. Prado102]
MFHKLASISQKLSPGLRKIIGNVGWLFAERVLTIIISLTVGIYVIRYLGAENFGKLSYSISFVGLFGAIAKLGLDAIVVRNIVQEESSTQEILGTTFVLKLIGSLVTILLISGAIWNLNNESEVRSITIIIGIGLLFSAFETIDFWFQSQVLAGAMTVVRSGQLILSSALKLLFITFGMSLMAFVWLTLIDSLLKAVGTIVVYFNHNQTFFRWKVSWSRAIEMLRDSWPLILSSVMVTIYMKIDQIMLGNMVGDREVGNYAAAIRFSEIWYFVPVAICSSVFPAILRAKQRSKQEYYDKLQQLYDLIAWVSLAIAIPMTFFSSSLMTTLLGQEYSKAGDILAWHIWAGPFVFLGVARTQWLMSENQTRFSFATTLLGTITNIILNFFLIPIYGGVGAAIATAISYAVATYFSCLFYPPMFYTAGMLTKALIIPFRIHQNLIYLSYVKKVFS